MTEIPVSTKDKIDWQKLEPIKHVSAFEDAKGVKTMKVRMLETKEGATDPTGLNTTTYEAGKKYDVYERLAQIFIENDWAEEDKEETIEVKNETKTKDTPEPRASKPKRGEKSSKS